MRGRFRLGGKRMTRHYLLVSDFDQTLSFNDSGNVLSESLGLVDFAEKVAGLSRLNLVQSGAELTYLLRHDPEFRRVRRDDLVDVGRRIRCKRNIDMLVECLAHGIDGRSEEHTSELQSQSNIVCRLLLEKKTDTADDQQGRT